CRTHGHGRDVLTDDGVRLRATPGSAKGEVSAYKVPHLVAVVDELPKGATGKILKRAIDPALLKADAGTADAAEPTRRD
ncbi:hypothetical protein ACWCRC_41890, partial [Streptomyces sp. NPDC001940]